LPDLLHFSQIIRDKFPIVKESHPVMASSVSPSCNARFQRWRDTRIPISWSPRRPILSTSFEMPWLSAVFHNASLCATRSACIDPLFLSLSPLLPLLSSIRFTSVRIRVTLNDLFDPVGRTYICKIPFVLRAHFENVFSNETSGNFGILCRRNRHSCAYAIDSRLIPDRRNVSVLHPRSRALTTGIQRII